MALGMLALLGALWGGLARLGWPVPSEAALVAFHGPLMVSGFLGTLIGIERAVAVGRPWAYAAPAATGLGALALMVGAPVPVGGSLLALGSAALVIVFGAILRRQLALFTAVMALGAVVWLVGQALWLGGSPISRVALWLAGFLVLTIAGERLELARVLRLSVASRALFAAVIALFLAGLGLTTIDFDGGVRLSGAGLLVLTVWLARHDVARRTVRETGLTRFIALSLLSGYAWLGVSGVLLIRYGGVVAGGPYDAALHAFFVGFVFAMIFGHAPLIFPAILGMPVAFRPAFYSHLVLLHLTLILRIAGDLLPWPAARQWGGLLNAVALLLFFANTAYGILRPVRRMT